MKNEKTNYFTLPMMAKIGILSAVSVVIMFFSIPLWFAPSFYKIDFSEVAVLLGGFALGPIAAICIEAIKVFLNLLLSGTQTMGIGELANFILGLSFVLPAALIYKRKKTMKRAIIGMCVGIVTFCIMGGLINAFVLLPVYSVAFGMPLDVLIGMGSRLNSSITNLQTFVFFAVTPFNLLKGFLSTLITLLLYKKISPILHKENFSSKNAVK